MAPHALLLAVIYEAAGFASPARVPSPALR
jgi:hypothetical protein